MLCRGVGRRSTERQGMTERRVPAADQRQTIGAGYTSNERRQRRARARRCCFLVRLRARNDKGARWRAVLPLWGACALRGRGFPFPASRNGQKGPPGRPGRGQGRALNPSTRTNAANEGTKADFWVGPHTPTPRTPPRMGGATQKCATAGAKRNPGATAPDHRRGWRRPRNERHHDYRREAANL